MDLHLVVHCVLVMRINVYENLQCGFLGGNFWFLFGHKRHDWFVPPHGLAPLSFIGVLLVRLVSIVVKLRYQSLPRVRFVSKKVS